MRRHRPPQEMLTWKQRQSFPHSPAGRASRTSAPRRLPRRSGIFWTARALRWRRRWNRRGASSWRPREIRGHTASTGVLGSQACAPADRCSGMGQRRPCASFGFRRHRIFSSDRLHPAGRPRDRGSSGRERSRACCRRLHRAGGIPRSGCRCPTGSTNLNCGAAAFIPPRYTDVLRLRRLPATSSG